MKKRGHTGRQGQGGGAVPQQSGMVPATYNHKVPGGVTRTQALATAGSGYSRNSFVPPKKKRRWPFVVAIVLLALVLIVGGVAFAGVVYMNSVSDKLHADVSDELTASLSSEQVQPGDPFYVLIMGTDESEERANSAEFAGDTFRSDSMILARIDPTQKIVTLISIERDTYVNIDGYGPNKINAAAAYGGAPLVVSTISEFAGVPISHYVQINFDGFKAAVDALGGIEVDVPIEIDDDEAGGYIAAGPQTLNGDQALILCRSRHAYEDAGYGGGDYYRMANQRMVLGAIAKKLLAADPVTMANTINSMADYITTDMDVASIISVANEMRGLDADSDIYSARNPTYSTYDDSLQLYIEYCDLKGWQDMMTRVDAGLPPFENESLNANNGGVTDGTVTATS